MKKTAIILVLGLLILTSLAAKDDYLVETQISVRSSDSAYAPMIVPELEIGDKVIISFQFYGYENNPSFLDKAAALYHNLTTLEGKLIGILGIPSDYSPELLQYNGIVYLPYGFDVDPITYIDEDGIWWYTFWFDIQDKPNKSKEPKKSLLEVEITANIAEDCPLVLYYYYFPNWKTPASIEEYFSNRSEWADLFQSSPRELKTCRVNYMIKVKDAKTDSNPDSNSLNLG